MYAAASNHMFHQLPPPRLLPALDNTPLWKPHVEIAPNCPRCSSSNTKFCYYNNYSLSQPRYFCKGCRRYWTKGGSLRNVPVGGGCRKNRRSKSARLSHQQNERASVTLNGNGATTPEDHLKTDDDNCDSGNIDLAAVFAKFLNDNSNLPQELDHNNMETSPIISTDASNSFSTTPDSAQNDAVLLLESQNHQPENDDDDDHHHHRHHGTIIGGDTSLLLDDFPCDDNDQLIMDQDLFELNETDAFGLQSLLSDNEVLQDAFWSNHTATPSDNSTFMQPIFQTQLELDYFPSDRDNDLQLRCSSNLISDNWSSFDLSGFQVHSSEDNYY